MGGAALSVTHLTSTSPTINLSILSPTISGTVPVVVPARPLYKRHARIVSHDVSASRREGRRLGVVRINRPAYHVVALLPNVHLPPSASGAPSVRMTLSTNVTDEALIAQFGAQKFQDIAEKYGTGQLFLVADPKASTSK